MDNAPTEIRTDKDCKWSKSQDYQFLEENSVDVICALVYS